MICRANNTKNKGSIKKEKPFRIKIYDNNGTSVRTVLKECIHPLKPETHLSS